MSEEKKSLRCSFCGRTEEQVERMIQGPGVRICDTCIRVCMNILDEDGEVTASVTCCPSAKLHLEAIPSATALKEGATYDMAAVRIRILDEFGNVAPYAQLPVRLTLEGAAQLVGPDAVTAEGGMCGTYIRTTGESGRAKLAISADGLTPVTIEFTVV